MATTVKVAKKSTTGAAARKPRSHPPYSEMISEAITSLKERTGSSQMAIAKFIEEKQKANLPTNFKKLLLVQLKKLVANGKLVKVKSSFKLAPKAPSAATKKPASASAAAKKPKSVSGKTGAKKTKSDSTKVGAKKPKSTTTAAARKPKSTTTAAKKVKPASVKVKKPVAAKSPAKKAAVAVKAKKPKSIKTPVKKVVAAKKAKK